MCDYRKPFYTDIWYNDKIRYNGNLSWNLRLRGNNLVTIMQEYCIQYFKKDMFWINKYLKHLLYEEITTKQDFLTYQFAH